MENITVIRSNRRTIAVEIKHDCQLIVRAPLKMREQEIRQFLQEKSAWIEKHLSLMKNRQTSACAQLTAGEIRVLAETAKQDLSARVRHFAPMLGVTVGRITIRNQKTRWGSCSAKGNLNFNCLLMLCPEEIRDYVVVHELSHRKELNHSAAFWAEVERILPDYRVRRKWLKEHSSQIVGRLG